MTRDSQISEQNAASSAKMDRRKLRRSSGIEPGKLAELETAFAVFRNEALKRKREVQHKRETLKSLTDWLLEQRNYFDELIEGLPI